MVWLPIVKTWRLNERMYGALTGLSKKMIQREYGDAQFRKWRRYLSGLQLSVRSLRITRAMMNGTRLTPMTCLCLVLQSAIRR